MSRPEPGSITTLRRRRKTGSFTHPTSLHSGPGVSLTLAWRTRL
uniref:Alternative protein TREH n=1 Tax=Homo sapiens TaxID=9606 RepID=L0R6S2_HUMAN|nr:alternative protein TREH [Homo sapiens]